MSEFSKVVRIGTTKPGVVCGRAVSVFCKISFQNGRLSISGVEGPLASGNALGGCGQIDMHLRAEHFGTFAKGWTRARAVEFLRIWGKWHLNDMVSGSPAQMAYLEANPIAKDDYANPATHYDVARERLANAGLNPDASHVVNGKPYAYGSAWLRREVPADCLDFLRALPDTDRTPAWV